MYERFLRDPIPQSIGSVQAVQTPAQEDRLRLPMRPLVRFMYAYILRLGFLDGRPGLVFCGLLAFYDFLASANRYEQQIARNRSRPESLGLTASAPRCETPAFNRS